MKNHQHLFVTVFTTGAAILSLELLSSRLMAPAFGNSLFIWGAILSVTMLSLAIGYAWGGSLAENPARASTRLVWHILIPAVWIGILPVFNAAMIRVSLALGVYWGPVLAAALILVVPLVLLSTAAPLAYGIYLQNHGGHPARSVGRLFATATAGSIAGALITAYLLIPTLGLRPPFLVITAALFLVISPSLARGVLWKSALALLCLLIAVRTLPPEYRGIARYAYGIELLHQETGPKGHFAVLHDQRHQTRILLLDGTSQNWVSEDDFSESHFDYLAMTLSQAASIRSADRRALIIGLGAGTAALRLQAMGFSVDAAEINPTVVRLAHDWFGLPDDLARVFPHDGRTVMRQRLAAGDRYDLILLDAAGGGHQPTHLYNRDAFALARGLLKPDGVFTANLIAITNPPSPVADHLGASLRSVFRQAEVVNLHPRHPVPPDRVGAFFLVASDRLHPPLLQPNIAPYQRHRGDPAARPVTDQWNPSDRWSVASNALFHQEIRTWFGDAALIPY